MKPSGFYDLTIAGGSSANLPVTGDYFKVMSATFPINVKSSFGELRGLIAGQGLENSPFDRLTIGNTSGSANTVRVFVGDENFIDGLSGAVSISTAAPVRAGTFFNTVVTVTTTSAQIDAANVDRAYLLIQNKSATGTVYLGFAAGVTAANGIAILPGGHWEPTTIPTNAIHAIGDIASNPQVLIVEA